MALRLLKHLINWLVATAVWYGGLWALSCMFWPLPTHLRWFHVLPVAAGVGLGTYVYWLCCVCHTCERYCRDDQEPRPASTLDELGCCRHCGKFWIGPVSGRTPRQWESAWAVGKLMRGGR